MARYRGLSSSQTTALAELARFAGDHGLGREITLRLSDDLVLAKVALGLPDTVPLPCHPRTIHALVRIGALVHRDGQVERRYWLTGLAGDCLDYTNLSPIARLCYDARFAAGRFVRARGRLVLTVAVLLVVAIMFLALTGRLG